MPEGPKPEAQRAESGVGSLGRGKAAPPHQPWAWGSAVSFPSGVVGGATATKRFSCRESLLKLSGGQVQEGQIRPCRTGNILQLNSLNRQSRTLVSRESNTSNSASLQSV